MDLSQHGVWTLAMPLAILAASTATWAACRWWYGRKLAAAALRLQKSEKGRLASQEQTQQARRQIEQLKSELASRQQNATESDRRRAELDAQLEAAEQASAADSAALPLISARGFADTQIMAK